MYSIENIVFKGGTQCGAYSQYISVFEYIIGSSSNNPLEQRSLDVVKFAIWSLIQLNIKSLDYSITQIVHKLFLLIQNKVLVIF